MRIFFIGDEGGTSTWFSQIRRKEHNYFSARFFARPKGKEIP